MDGGFSVVGADSGGGSGGGRGAGGEQADDWLAVIGWKIGVQEGLIVEKSKGPQHAGREHR